MKTKRILIIVAVVFALLFCACVGGLIYCGIMTSYTFTCTHAVLWEGARKIRVAWPKWAGRNGLF